MKWFVPVAIAASCALPVGNAQAITLERPAPAWLTPQLRAQIHAAGAEGVPVAEEFLNTTCPGAALPGVSAGACIVAPYGCTANFIFSAGDWRTQPYLGTAGHCADRVGDVVVAQVDTITLAEIGTVTKRIPDEEPGKDFALIRVFPEVAAKWGVRPALPTGGPQGVYTGCGPTNVKMWGHGYGVAVGQGKPGGGFAPFWFDDAYGFLGSGMLGDSGSGVTLVDGRSAGNFTHLIVFDPDLRFAPGTMAGMRSTAILRYLGTSFAQVDADGSLSRAVSTNCAGLL